MKTNLIKQVLKYSEFATEQAILEAIQRVINAESSEDGLSGIRVISTVLNNSVKHPKEFARQYLTSRITRDIYLLMQGNALTKRYFIETQLHGIIITRLDSIHSIDLDDFRNMRSEILEIYNDLIKDNLNK